MKPVLYHPPDLADTARKFAPLCELVAAAEVPILADGYALWLDTHGLALLMSGHTLPFRLRAEDLVRRARGPSLSSRACAAGRDVSVLDPFAGYGLDALELALRGCSVTAVEQLPVAHLLCRDLAERAGVSVEAHTGDAWAWLTGARVWDVVYLDPMFPLRNKKALPNRGLQHLRELNADQVQPDLDRLLEAARHCARHRVVLKRRSKDAVVGSPNHQLKGRSVRFDVYA